MLNQPALILRTLIDERVIERVRSMGRATTMWALSIIAVAIGLVGAEIAIGLWLGAHWAALASRFERLAA